MEFSVGSVPGTPVRILPVRQRTRLHVDRPLLRGRLLSDVFDAFPMGIVIVSDDRHVVAWNPAVAELMGDCVESAVTCCDIFGCRTPGTELERVCLTERALAHGGGLGDVSVDVREHPGRNVLVNATVFPHGSGRSVLFAIRTAATTVAATPAVAVGEKIRIRTLGETVVETPTVEIRGDWLEQRAGRLLKFLVVNRYTPMHADVIAEALWPRARADTTNTVRHFVHTLREKLEPGRPPYARSAFVLARNGGYVLNPDRVVVDADEFEREARGGLIALAANNEDGAVEQLRHALAMYHGDFLPDERFEDWAMTERERLRDLATKPLRALAQLTNDPNEATLYLERLAEMEPLDVDIHRELIIAWLQQGRRGRAMRHYRALQSRLMRELGERVSFDLSDLMRPTVWSDKASVS